MDVCYTAEDPAALKPLRCEACEDNLSLDAPPEGYLPCCLGVLCVLCAPGYGQICPGVTCDGRHAVVGWSDTAPDIVKLQANHTTEVEKCNSWYAAAVAKTWLLPVPLTVYKAADTKAATLAAANLAAAATLLSHTKYVQALIPYTFNPPGYFVVDVGPRQTLKPYVQRWEVLDLMRRAARHLATSVSTIAANPNVHDSYEVFGESANGYSHVGWLRWNPNAPLAVRADPTRFINADNTNIFFHNSGCTIMDVLTYKHMVPDGYFSTDHIYQATWLTFADMLATFDQLPWNFRLAMKYGIATYTDILAHQEIPAFAELTRTGRLVQMIVNMYPQTAAITVKVLNQLCEFDRASLWLSLVRNTRVSVETLMTFSDEITNEVAQRELLIRLTPSEVHTYEAKLLRWSKKNFNLTFISRVHQWPANLKEHFGVVTRKVYTINDLHSGMFGQAWSDATVALTVPLTYIRETINDTTHRWVLDRLEDRSDVVFTWDRQYDDGVLVPPPDTFWNLLVGPLTYTIDDAPNHPDLPWSLKSISRYTFGVV